MRRQTGMPERPSIEVLSSTGLLNLMRLTSPSLPIGAFAYSQGLEFACDQNWVHDADSAVNWIGGLLRNMQARLDVPVLGRLIDAWHAGSTDEVEYWSRYLLASRESMELRNEDHYLGKALAILLADLGINKAGEIMDTPSITYATAFSLAAVHWRISKPDACSGYLWAWCENQVGAAIKLIPLGQTAGQRMISSLIDEIPFLVQQGLQLEDGDIGGTSVGLGIASANHETQYSRLFRS